MDDINSDRHKMVEEVNRSNRDEVLIDAVLDVRWVIHYAASRGVSLAENDVGLLLEAMSKVKNEEISPAFEAKFWASYQRVAEAIQPATVDSIRNVLNKNRVPGKLTLRRLLKTDPVTFAKEIVARYRAFTLLALVILIVLQIYWVIGWNITKDIEKIDSLMRAPGVTQANIETYNSWHKADVISLSAWLGIIPFELGSNNGDAKPDTGQSRGKVSSAIIILQVLSTYILPLFYGWIGALAFSLRSLERSIREFTLKRSSEINLALRQILGPLAGLAAGWILIGENSILPVQSPPLSGAPLLISDIPTIASLPIAFAAGYSVELLFAALDRFVAAFGGTPSQRSVPQQAGSAD